MSRHARPASGRGGGWFVLLAFAILVVGGYLANAVDSTTQRPAIGLAALAAAALALLSARSERQRRGRMEELSEAQRRDEWRMRAEVDEAHARSQRALERALSTEAAVHTLIAATESLLAVQRHSLAVAAAAQPARPAVPVPQQASQEMPQEVRAVVAPPEASPIFEQTPARPAAAPLPPAPPVFTPQPPQAQPAAAGVANPWAPDSIGSPPAGTDTHAPAAALLERPTTLVWPLADLPAPQRQHSLDLPLVRADR